MEKIYMIPVNDAYSSADGCPLCRLRDKAEQNYLEYYLGPSLMEPDTRIITNKTGFCPDHMGKLNRSVTNRLGLGLMMHTHLKDFNDDITSDLCSAAPQKAGLIKGRTTDYKAKLNSIADMYSHDPAFKDKFAAVPYHCLPHLSMLLRQSAKLGQNDAASFVSALAEKNKDAFEGLIGDVEWFTLKFDYRNQDKPWGNSKNSIQRSMRFLSSDGRDFDEQSGKKQA